MTTKRQHKGAICYFSDLFIAVMVIAWIAVLVIMCGFAAYATIVQYDTSLWGSVENLVAIPLSCGGAIWMIKNSVQHAIANKNGHDAPEDFPRVDGADISRETADAPTEEACG